MDAKQFIESGTLETYVMGLATEQEAKLVAEMSACHPEVKAELLAIEDAIQNYDQKNAVNPPEYLKSVILAEIEKSSKVRTLDTAGATKSNTIFRYAAAIAFILLPLCAYYIYSLRGTVSWQEENLASYKLQLEMSKRSEQITDSMLTANIDFSKTLLDEISLLKEPGMKSIELKGMEVAPEAKAMVYANTTTGDSYLEIMNLPPAPAGMQYQFWGIVDDKPVDAGMIPLEEDLSGIHPMKTVPNTKAYAISLEPSGGSPQPTGKIYVMGNS